MKKILLTWYGMTDLRAAFGLEDTTGPILGLLNENDYDDVFILCHTQKGKDAPSDFSTELEKTKANNSDISITREFMKKYSNTITAHNVYTQWLLDKLANKNTNISFHAVELERLNDSEGIYSIVDKVMAAVSNISGKKEVHLFLSPGTPVMAFSWALAAIKHQQLNIKLISSSVVGQKAEFIDIPSAWREWRRKKDFDIIFDLFGEQRMPSYLSINQFSCDKHVFLSSKAHDASVMKKFLSDESFDEIKINPYDPLDIKAKILEYKKHLSPGTKIAINLTGGTKLMYAGAMEACRELHATPFYFNIDDDSVMFLDSFEKASIKNISLTKTFFELHTNEVEIAKQKKGKIEKAITERAALTNEIYTCKSKLANEYKSMLKCLDDKKSFEKKIANIYIKYTPNKTRQISFQNGVYEFKNDDDFEAYICGGWFEEYVFAELKPLEEKGEIFDLRINLRLCLDNTGKDRMYIPKKGFEPKVDYQEIDVCFSDGKRLYIIECKSGIPKSDYIEKLKNITLQYGGLGAVGILATCFELPNKVVKKKLEDNKMIYALKNDYAQNIEQIIKSKKRK